MAMPYKDAQAVYIPNDVLDNPRVDARAFMLYCHIVDGAPVGNVWLCTDQELRDFGFKERRAELAITALVDAGLVSATRGHKGYTLQILDREGHQSC